MVLPETESPFTLPRSDTQMLRTPDGREYQLFIAWPSEPAPAAGFPIVYMLDARAAFATMVEAIRMCARRTDATNVAPAIVVGIEHRSQPGSERTDRSRDFTWPDGGAGSESGQAPEFLSFLEHDVKEVVERRFAVNRERQALFGHSLGGLFVLYALLHEPRSFQGYVAVSPSVWRNRDVLQAALTARAANPPPPLGGCNVMITVGEYEQTLAPWQIGTPHADGIAVRRHDRRMIEDARATAGQIEPLVGRMHFEEFPEADHASVVLLSISRCLRFCLSPT